MSPWYNSPIVTVLEVLFDRNRVIRQNALLWVLAITTERQQPLGPMVQALAQDEGNRYWKSRLLTFGKHLNEGIPLPDALERVPGLLPADLQLAVRVGTETGTLPAMLRQVAKDFAEEQEEDYSTWKGTLVYLAALLMALLSVGGFVMYYIIPKFKKIFEDFGTELPQLTIWVIQVADEFAQWFPLILMGGMGFLAWFGWQSRRGSSAGPLRWLLFSSPRGQAPVLLRMLGVVMEAGRPLAGALSTLARHHVSSKMRNSLLFVRNEIENGGELWERFAEAGLLNRSEARILEAAQRAGNLPWALDELAGSIDRDIDYRSTLLLEIFRPAFLLAVGLAVGIFVIAMFLPLVKLMNDFS